jgi:primosomal protein N' (replication factor Y)
VTVARTARTARVVPDVVGLDKSFDYAIPDDLPVDVGALVRVPLHGRRVGGWVVALDPPDAHDRAELKPIAKLTGSGPSVELIGLAGWASVRWAGRVRQFLTAASPHRAVTRIPAAQRTGMVVEPRSPASSRLLEAGGGVLRLPPTSDPLPAVLSATALGPALVVVPSVDQALLLAARLRRSGLSVASMPDDWAAAAGGVDVVVGARSTAWAPCPGIGAAVVLDEHDEALQEEGSPTWHARDVLVERCRRAGVPLLAVSPCPTLTAISLLGEPVRPPVDRERAGWPIVDVIDRSDEEPWKRSLVTSELVRHLRDPSRVVLCVSNTPGRSALLACRACRALACCERCAAAVGLTDEGLLACRRCGASRPAVCLACGAGRFANLRPGVSRLVEELGAAADRHAVLVTGGDAERPEPAGVYVGTEAVLHRVEQADTVAFLDFDRELLAPRYRAAEQAMALLVRAARLVGRRAAGGRILVQTFIPDHPVLQAAVRADPGRFVAAERASRQMLGLPPFGALAELGGAGVGEFVGSLPTVDGVAVVADGDGGWVVRAGDWMQLGEVLSAGTRPPGSRLRIAVDPPR